MILESDEHNIHDVDCTNEILSFPDNFVLTGFFSILLSSLKSIPFSWTELQRTWSLFSQLPSPPNRVNFPIVKFLTESFKYSKSNLLRPTLEEKIQCSQSAESQWGFLYKNNSHRGLFEDFWWLSKHLILPVFFPQNVLIENICSLA